MSRLMSRQIEVGVHEGSPTRFVRRVRGRAYAYTVTDVLARWVESGQWWIYSPGDGPMPATGERQVWRVEARCADGTGVYDLSADGDSWRLLRIVD